MSDDPLSATARMSSRRQTLDIDPFERLPGLCGILSSNDQFEGPLRDGAMEAAKRPSIAAERIRDLAIEERAYDVVDAEQHFYRKASRFVFCCHEGVLTVHGSVPSFYLKQLLQHALRHVPGIRAVDNCVIVVSSKGMSSDSDG